MNFKRVLVPRGRLPRVERAAALRGGSRKRVQHATFRLSLRWHAIEQFAQEIESLKEQVTYLLRDNFQAGPEISGCLNSETLIVAGHNPGAAIVAEAARQQIDLIGWAVLRIGA